MGSQCGGPTQAGIWAATHPEQADMGGCLGTMSVFADAASLRGIQKTKFQRTIHQLGSGVTCAPTPHPSTQSSPYMNSMSCICLGSAENWGDFRILLSFSDHMLK